MTMESASATSPPLLCVKLFERFILVQPEWYFLFLLFPPPFLSLFPRWKFIREPDGPSEKRWSRRRRRRSHGNRLGSVAKKLMLAAEIKEVAFETSNRDNYLKKVLFKREWGREREREGGGGRGGRKKTVKIELDRGRSKGVKAHYRHWVNGTMRETASDTKRKVTTRAERKLKPIFMGYFSQIIADSWMLGFISHHRGWLTALTVCRPIPCSIMSGHVAWIMGESCPKRIAAYR